MMLRVLSLVASWLTAGVSGFGVGAQDRPVCTREPIVPVYGTLHSYHVEVADEEDPSKPERTLDAWDLDLGHGCGMALREAPHITSCLKGSWVVLMGASQSSVWTVQLVNSLVPGSLVSNRDGFITDGVYEQLLDVIIEDGKVVYKNVVYTSDWRNPGPHEGVHTRHNDMKVLPMAYAQLARAPPFSPNALRVTNMLAEWWDEVDLGLIAIEAAPAGWVNAKVFPVVAVGLWYAYAYSCFNDWCRTRASIAGKDIGEIVQSYTDGMDSTMESLRSFCSPGGRAGVHGCTMMSIEYCSEMLSNQIYGHLYKAFKEKMSVMATPNIRFFDLWMLTMQIPESCLWGHVTPASAAITWQVLLSSVCKPEDAARGRLVAFDGPTCRSEQIIPMCPGQGCKDFHYSWDYALSQPCLLRPVIALQKQSAYGAHAYANLEVDMGSGTVASISTSVTATLTATSTSTSTTLLPPLKQNTTPLLAAELVARTISSTRTASTTTITTQSGNGTAHVLVVTAVAGDSSGEEASAPLPGWLRSWLLAISLLSVALLSARVSSSGPPSKGYAGVPSQPISAMSLSSDDASQGHVADRQESLSPLIGDEEQSIESISVLSWNPPKTCEDIRFTVPLVADGAAASPPATGDDRFSFGLARCLASLHVVVGHMHARHLLPDFYLFRWGFTWVPWFFMLSGFILCTAELRKPRQELVFEYVSRRLVSIYPLYAVSVLASAFMAEAQGFAPANWVLVLQAWLLQAWIPQVTEWGLQMQCWFLSCLVFYWAIFPLICNRIARLTLRAVLSNILMIFTFPWLYLLVPDVIFSNTRWYDGHHFGHMKTSIDVWVVMLKFHPLCYLHVFLLGMLLARLRMLQAHKGGGDGVDSRTTLSMDLLAPAGYVGLAMVFLLPPVRPPDARLAARLFWLLPLQAAVLLGLAGLPGHPQPVLARLTAPLNFLESYSYAVYVLQFLCMRWWGDMGFQVGSIPFFIFLASISIFTVIAVQKPADNLWRMSPRKASLGAPALLSVLLLGLSQWGKTIPHRSQAHRASVEELLGAQVTPALGMLDVRLPLVLAKDSVTPDDEQGSSIINPSVIFLDAGRLAVAARLHRREMHMTWGHYQGASVQVLEEYWHSQILFGSLDLNESAWSQWHVSGKLPESKVEVRPWTGLYEPLQRPWAYPNLCIRESWLPENSTLIRLIVTGPEDPKLLGQRHSESGAASAKDELLVAFNSYPPVGADGKCGVAAASQMYLARNVDVVHPTQVKIGQHLSCGHLNRAEKNWIPFERNGKFYFVYSLLPHEVVEINPDGSCGKRFNSAFTPLAHLQAMDFDKAIRGSAQAVFIDDAEGTPNLPEPHFLAMLHITDTKVRRYAHFAYRFKAEPPFEIVQISKQLPLQILSPGDMSSAPFAFVSGLAVRERQVVISYAAGDRDPRALLLKMERLDEMFASDEAGSEISS